MKIKNLLDHLAGLILAVLLRVVYPFKHIRFGRLPSHEIGHYATNIEVYLCERDAFASNNRRSFDFWYRNPDGPVSNHQLDTMWSRTIRIVSSPAVKHADQISRRLPFGSKFSISHHDRDAHALFDKTLPHLSFTKDEIDQGEKFLDTLRRFPGQKHVCLAVRDVSYKRSQFDDHDPIRDEYRNSDINSYKEVARTLASEGYLVFRMGAKVNHPFEVDSDGVFDYASNGMRSDFLDVYLSASCEIFISSVLGIDSIAEIFRRPRVLTNYIPIANFGKYGPRDLIIPKQYWKNDEGRFLRFSEIVQSPGGLGSCTNSYEYGRSGVGLIENSPAEITQATRELLALHAGLLQLSSEDEHRRKVFWDYYNRLSPAPIRSAIAGQEPNIGVKFLSENPHWVT